MKKLGILAVLLTCFQSIFAQYWTASGNNIYNSLPGYVGIGTAPSWPLDVAGTIHSSYSLNVDQPAGGTIGGWFKGGASSSGSVVVHGNQGNWPAWWMSGAQSYMKLGYGGGNETWAGGINIDLSNHVGINTLNTSGYTLNVNGSAVFDGVTVTTFGSNNPKATPWADYVFDKDYQLPSLQSVAAYIASNHHLAGIPTTAEVQKNGLDLGINQAKLLEKIEQLTLYTIDLQRQADQSRTENGKLMQLLQTQSQQLAVFQHQVEKLQGQIDVIKNR